MTDDPFGLRRFVDAQAAVFDAVLAELSAGRKRTHWMWFVFPQIGGLGASATARRYAITSLAEAEAYLRNDLLGPRLRHCTEIVNGIEGRSANALFGSPDDLKFRSSMTLFLRATADNDPFVQALAEYSVGEPDQATLDRL